MAVISKDMAAFSNVNVPNGAGTASKRVKLVTITLKPVRSQETERMQVPVGTPISVLKEMVQQEYGISCSAKFLKFDHVARMYIGVEGDDEIKRKGTLYIMGVAWLRDPAAPPRTKLLAANPNAFMACDREKIPLLGLAQLSTTGGGLPRHEHAENEDASSVASVSTASSSRASSLRSLAWQQSKPTLADTAVSACMVVYAY